MDNRTTRQMDRFRLGQEVRARRELLGMTQTALRERTGISQGELSKIESGLRAKNSALHKIEEALIEVESGTSQERLTRLVLRLANLVDDWQRNLDEGKALVEKMKEL